ncbi:MAG: hypothetical protein ABJ308_02465 [Halieaceae bacterium]
MATLLEFPSQRVQGLAFLQEQVRKLLSARGADEELIEFAADTVRRVYERSIDAENYSFSLELPTELSDADAAGLSEGIRQGIEQIREENHAVVVRLIAELVMAEVKFFQANRD